MLIDKTFVFKDDISESMSRDIEKGNFVKDLIEGKDASFRESTYSINSLNKIKENESDSKIKNNIKIIESEYFKQWIGRVILIENNDTFVALIKSIYNHEEKPKIVRFNKNKVKIINYELLSEGAVFYWTVGLFRNNKMTLEKRSEIRFKMVSNPSQLLLKKLGEELEQIYDGISWLE